MTEGRRALLAVLQRTLARHVAARCRVSPSRVSEWASGGRLPGADARRVLEESYAIPPASWVSTARSVHRRRSSQR